ncbi:phosphotransferase [Candidatus Woesearchaeota archaeon]|nr:phosphotransferase [Candidatus Woesearchaeota archaeon]
MRFTKAFKDHLAEKLKDKVVSIKELAHGAHNINYTVKCKKNKYLLRVYANIQFDNVDKEYKVLKLLDGKYAPKVFFKDKSKKYLTFNYLVEEFIEGKVIKKFRPEHIKQAAIALKNIHKTKKPTKKRIPCISRWTRRTLENNNPQAHLDLDWNELYKKARIKATSLLKDYYKNKKHLELIHGDPIFLNCIFPKKGTVLIDWEFGVFGDFVEDLATFIIEDKLSKKEEHMFLKAYGYGIKKKEYDIVLGQKIKRNLALIAWLAQRINMVKQGHVHKYDKLQDHFKTLKKEVNYLKKML